MANETTQRLRCYVQAHLGEVCENYSDVVEELQFNRTNPSQCHKPSERIAFLQKLADEKLDYMQRVTGDLKRLK